MVTKSTRNCCLNTSTNIPIQSAVLQDSDIIFQSEKGLGVRTAETFPSDALRLVFSLCSFWSFFSSPLPD